MIFDYVDFYDSPIGCLKIQLKEGKVYSITRTFQRRKKRVPKEREPAGIVFLKSYLDKYFLKGVSDVKLIRRISFYSRGTVFQKKVWKELQKIPFGKTRTYTQVARKIGSPLAFRAVGSACGHNPFLLIVPCHRVVAKTGLGGFALGLPAKTFLLAHEQSKL